MGLQLARFDAEDGLRIDGLLARTDSEITIIHVHGKCGDFYQNEFISYMDDIYPSSGINFLSFNHRGHDCLAEGYLNGKVTYLGGSVERFEDTVIDINAAIKYVSQFSRRIILQGHSNGCEKILYYATKVNSDIELIMLSPSDSYRMQTYYIAPETVDHQLVRLKAQYNHRENEWLPPNEYGIKVEGKEYEIPVTAGSLISLLEGPAFRLLRYDEAWGREPLPTKLFAYVGGKDPYLGIPLDNLEVQLQKRIKDVTIGYLPEGNHHFKGLEREVLTLIVNWVLQKKD